MAQEQPRLECSLGFNENMIIKGEVYLLRNLKRELERRINPDLPRPVIVLTPRQKILYCGGYAPKEISDRLLQSGYRISKEDGILKNQNGVPACVGCPYRKTKKTE